MPQRGKKVVRGKARAGKKGPTSARDLDMKRIAGAVKGGKPTKKLGHSCRHSFAQLLKLTQDQPVRKDSRGSAVEIFGVSHR